MTNEELLKVIEEAKASKSIALDLSNRGITELPPEFFQLTSLTSINLSWNQLTKLPPEIGQLTNLKDIDLWNNQLTSLPQEFAKLTKLDMLNLGNNKLTTMPSEICQLTNLTRLRLGENQLTALPPEIGQLTKLKELALFKNRLTALPSEICQLKKLTVLNLNSNQLTPMPLEICKLKGLTELHLSFNQLTTLPPEICQLTKLTHLNLNGTQLTKLPSEFFQLTSLIWLNLSVNKLSPLPSQIGQLTSLKVLNLSWNQLSTLPPEICKLTNLTNLDLWGNQLTPLPLEIYQLTNLRDLNIGHNQLDRLSHRICQLTKLETLRLDDNPLVSPSWEIAIQGIESIRSYFNELQKGYQPVNEVKIILVGEGAAGKTSLTKALLGEPFNENEDATHGIRISEWEPEIGSQKIKVNIWDFGGQEIMHATHQFFLSKRSLYVLVLDQRRGDKTEYWLRHIESFGGNSPVLIVLNKEDVNLAFDLNRNFLLQKYPIIKGFPRTSCKMPKGIDEFREILLKELAQMLKVEPPWLKSWFMVKQQIEEMGKPYISCSEYETCCREAGITETEDQEKLVDTLHNLGVAVHFKELALNNTYILDPKWVTKGVYKIITSDEVVNDKGILRLKKLEQLLRKQNGEPFCYDRGTHQFLIELMKKFELCYSLDKETLLIPQLLPVMEPEFPFDYAGSLQFVFLYDDFLPQSILSRFMVKLHKDIEDDLRWRTGVVLKNKESGCTATVKADGEKRRINIWVNGPHRKEYLHFLWYSLRDINATFEKLPVRERIPMPDAPYFMADYETLIMYAERGIDTYIPDGSKNEYSVHELLGLVEPDREDQMLEMLRMILERLDDQDSMAEMINSIVELKPNIGGIGINLNEAFRRILAWDKQRQRKARR